MADAKLVRTRFAPSPTGHLHVGGARTALFCWAYARKHGGRFLLRIEDTDQKRSSDAAVKGVLDDLTWLGIDWDEGPEFQSQRLEIYNKYLEQLIEAGKAYRAFETPEELEAARKTARDEKQNYRYNRAALKLTSDQIKSYLDEKRPHVIRFKVQDGETVTVHDEILGDVTVNTDEMDDFVIRKADGYPTYHFAVVVDDGLMGVTHVIRAQEHLNNTTRHVLIQEALGFGRPKYAHMSVITNPDGSKMSKRDRDKALRATIREKKLTSSPIDENENRVITSQQWDTWINNKESQLDVADAQRLANVLGVHLPGIDVDDFRRDGYLPNVLVNYLALLGWSPGRDIEKFDRNFFIQEFDFDRVIKSPAKFDREKLLAFNLDAIQELSIEAFTKLLKEHAERFHADFLDRLSNDQFVVFARANQSRSKTLNDPFETCRFFIVGDDEISYEDSNAVRKAMTKGEPCGYDHLEAIIPFLDSIANWTVESIETTVKRFADQHAEGKLGNVAQPLRIAVTGGTISPAIFETLTILGKQSVLARIKRCLAQRENAVKTG